MEMAPRKKTARKRTVSPSRDLAGAVESRLPLVRAIKARGGAVLSAAFSPDGTRLVTASADGISQVWEVASGKAVATLAGHEGSVNTAAFNGDGTRVVTASNDGTARLWDAASGALLRSLEDHKDAVTSAAFSRDSRQVITSSSDLTARLWDAASGQRLEILVRHGGPVTRAAFSPDGTRLVTASSDLTARLWDAASGEPRAILEGHEARVTSAAFSPDGTKLVTASADGTARLWDAASGQKLGILQGHGGRIAYAMFSPDGARVVTASANGTARLWDAASHEPLATSEDHGGALYSAAFSPDGAQVVTACHDGTVRLWDAIKFRVGTPPRPLALRAGIRSDSVERQSDALGVRADAQAFARLIADRGVEPPLAIGVFGEWGSGKSFFMRLLREEIGSIAASGGDAFYSRIVQIEFNAWHYVEANLWASLVNRIFSHLHSHLEDRNEEQSAERLFAELTTARQLRGEAQQDLELAKSDLANAEEELKKKQVEIRQALTLKQLAREEVWQGLKVDKLPDPLKSKITQFSEEAGLDRILASGRDLRQALDEFRGVWGRAHAAILAWRRLSTGLQIGTALLFLLGCLVLFDFGGFFSGYIFPGVEGMLGRLAVSLAFIVGVLGAALRHSRSAIALAEWLDAALKEQQQTETQALIDAARIEARQAEERIADAEERVLQAQAAIREASVPRRLARFIEERVSAGDYQKHLGIIAMIRDDFEKLSDLMELKHGLPLHNSDVGVDPSVLKALPMIDRVVLYIDDLDRCPTAKVIQVLEAIHLLLAFPLFVVVVGLDVRWASRSLLEHYPRHLIGEDRQGAAEAAADGIAAAEPDGPPRRQHDRQEDATPHDYLEKIFQIPFWLQPLETDSSQQLLAALTPEGSISFAASRPGQESEDEEKPPARPEGSGIAPAVPTDPSQGSVAPSGEPAASPGPEPLSFDRREREFLLSLAACVGSSPRRVKRFVNIYRIIKAACPAEERSGFVIDKGASGSYRAVLTLLALTTGAPRLANLIFARIMQARDDGRVAALRGDLEREKAAFDPREAEAALGALRRYEHAEGGDAALTDLRRWQPRIGRFTFRLGRC